MSNHRASYGSTRVIDRLLLDTINETSINRMTATLVQVCEKFPDAREWVRKELLLGADDYTDRSSSSEPLSDESEQERHENEKWERKRPRPKYDTCEQCSEEFDVTFNEDGDCMWHDGNLEPDDDAWPDHEEETHGPVDTEENRRDYPENFIWDCCEGDGLSEGCQKSRHVGKNEEPFRRQRRRVAAPIQPQAGIQPPGAILPLPSGMNSNGIRNAGRTHSNPVVLD